MAGHPTFERDANGRIITVPFDPAWYLADEEQISAFLNDVREDDSPGFLVEIQQISERARKMNAGEVIPVSGEAAAGWMEYFKSQLTICKTHSECELLQICMDFGGHISPFRLCRLRLWRFEITAGRASRGHGLTGSAAWQARYDGSPSNSSHLSEPAQMRSALCFSQTPPKFARRFGETDNNGGRAFRIEKAATRKFGWKTRYFRTGTWLKRGCRTFQRPGPYPKAKQLAV